MTNHCSKRISFQCLNFGICCSLVIFAHPKRQWQPTPVLWLGRSHGRRSLVGCSPWGFWESDKTEWHHFHFSLSCIGEGYGNPLQCSCLENPRDRGAWWAAIYGVAQSWTRLKWLSSNSSSSYIILLCFQQQGWTPGAGLWPLPPSLDGTPSPQKRQGVGTGRNAWDRGFQVSQAWGQMWAQICTSWESTSKAFTHFELVIPHL